MSTLATIALLGGCQESTVSGPQLDAASPTSIMMVPDDAPRLGLNGGNPSNTSADFTVSPKGGIFFVGNHAVVFPANSICNPATSGYGPGTWDSPCESLTSNLKIHAEIRVSKGRTWVDFSPALRFVPAKTASKWVYIYMYTPGASGARDLSSFNILYAASIGGATTDESLEDPTLRTYVDTRSGLSMRRIKHFSGYTSSGRSCNPSEESGCVAGISAP